VAVRDAAPQAPIELIEEAARMINEAEQPVLYLGGGVVHSGAAQQAVTLAEQAGLPTTMTLMALGAMPMDHPLSIGMLGMHGARYTNFVLEEADLLICVGARFDDRAIGKAAQFCPRAKIVHIDVDPSELDKIKNAHVAINGDVAEVLDALIPRVKVQLRKRWLSHVDSLKTRFPMQFDALENPRSHYGLINAVAAALDDEAIITTDVGQHQMWVAQAYPFRRPRQWLTSGGLGTMGFGMPVALGAALAAPERTVVCFSGDGSIMMNIQELATLAEQGLNVKIVLMNNNALGLVYQQQSLFYGKRTFASRYAGAPDFMKIAEGFGIPAVDLDLAANPRASLAQALQTPGPCLIHASIDREEFVYPMVPPGAANTEMIGG
ncbi:MAG: acetolactate synthase catalytic subunit, partial [Betaproteobacteria bacterium HGW-Betaproteobacteria-13]